ncbi:MAG: CHASE2 domain-containing protein, partial [Anaerolineae bacterium]|nr:CHASE2 domain-containing protein [Anaerolineae bacterium]
MAVMRAGEQLAALRRGKARSSRWLTGLGLGFFAAVLALVLWWGGLFVQVRLALDDVFVVPRQASESVAIVAIDDPSLAHYGRFAEWPRDLYADLVERLAQGGARVVALDLLLAEPSEGDDALAAAIAAARASAARTRTVIAAVGTQRDASITDLVGYQIAVKPVAAFVEDGALVGSVNVLPDQDGLVRHVPLLIQIDQALYPSLGFGAFLSHRGVSSALLEEVVTRAPGEIQMPGGLVIPTDSLGRMRVNYFSVPGQPAFDAYSFHEVLSGAVDPAVFEGRIVLVGLMEQTALTDSYPVPGSRDGTLMAGVEIHANVVETLLQGVPLRAQSQPAQAFTILALALLAGVIFQVLPLRWYLPALGGLTLGWVLVVTLIYNLRGLVISLFYSLLALLLAALVVGFYRVVEEVFRRQRTEILLASALGAFEQNFSLAGILAGIADDMDRILGSKGARAWLWDAPRSELRLAHPALPRGETLPLALRPWQELADEALKRGAIVSRQHRVAIPLIWHDTRVGVLTGQARWRVGFLR